MTSWLPVNSGNFRKPLKNNLFFNSLKDMQFLENPNVDGLAKSPSMRPARGAQINDSHRKSLICKERENNTFPFPWREKSRIGLFATLTQS